MAVEDYPKDVQEIIEYTKLRKKYPGKNRELKIVNGFKEPITKRQMYLLLNALKEFDKSHAKSKLIICEQCGKEYDPDSDFIDEEDIDLNNHGRINIHADKRDLCKTCRKLRRCKKDDKDE